MNWIYLSPHLDDVVLSCGGLIWEQAQAGETMSIWTICAGDPPAIPLSPFAESLHARWEAGRQAVARRRQEDIAACTRISATAHHLAIPDCIYRYANGDELDNPDDEQAQGDKRFLYASEDALFGPLHPAEKSLIQKLSVVLSTTLPPDAEIVSPLSLGGHVDHRLTRATAEGLGRPLWHYADYPYALETLDQIEALRQDGWKEIFFAVSQAGLTAWQEAVAAHRSQISTFWSNLDSMRAALRHYYKLFNGAVLWQPPHGERRVYGAAAEGD